MKVSISRSLIALGTFATLIGASLAAMAPASAATVASPSESGGIVTICPGTDVDLNDVTSGQPLPIQTQRDMIAHFQWKCAHPNAGTHGSTVTSSGRTMSPNKSISGVGELIAHLVITVGSVTWWTTASSMPVGPDRTLECTSRINNGTWGNCGNAEGTGSALTTRTNSYCPPKGQEFEVEAWLLTSGGDYWDDAYGVTK
jgi:hypothetical protein